jgi:hypothetical protein
MGPHPSPRVATLQTLVFLGRIEEKRLRAILADAPKFMVKMKTRAHLENVVRITKAQSEELEILLAGA